MKTAEIYDRLTEIFQDVFVDETLVITPETRKDEIDEWDDSAQKILLNRINSVFHTSIEELGNIVRMSDLADLLGQQSSRENADVKQEFMKALESVNPEITREEGKDLTGIIDSLNIMNIVIVLEDTFDVEFEPEDIVPENFENLQAIWNLFTQRLQ